MSPQLQILFDKIEQQRFSLVNELQRLSESDLQKKPRPGKWSIAEILSHVIAAERLSVSYLKKKSLGIQAAPKSGLWAEVKMGFLKISQRLPGLRFRAPRVVVQNTKQFKTLLEISSEWDVLRMELQSFLETIPEGLVNRLIYRHARAGYLNLRHALLFFHEHIVHHSPQIKWLANTK